MNRRVILWVAIAGCVVLGCSEPDPTDRGPDGPSPGVPRRVVVMAPALAEMLDALELTERVVGVGDYGPWPASMSGLPSVGGYASPNVEQALALRAEMVLTTASDAASPSHRALKAVGISVEALDTSTFEGVFLALERIGGRFGRGPQARQIAETMRSELRTIADAAASAPRRRVLFVVGRDPLYVAGPGSHIDEMIEIVGGENVAGDLMAPYQQMSLEAALERRPEVIVDTSDNRAGDSRGRHGGEWSRWEFLPAVRDDRVYHVEPGRLVIPGLRLPEMTRLLGTLVQPEIFGPATAAELE